MYSIIAHSYIWLVAHSYIWLVAKNSSRLSIAYYTAIAIPGLVSERSPGDLLL